MTAAHQDISKPGQSRRQILLAALAAGLSLPVAMQLSTASAQAKKLTVGFSIWDLTIPFAVPLARSLRETAAKNNIDLKLVEAKFDASLQAQQISEFIAQKVDVIAFTPVDVKAIRPSIDQARAAHIPMIAVAGIVDGIPYIGADDVKFGELMGGLILEALDKSGTKGPYNIAFLRGLPGGAPDRLRRNGIMNVVGKRPDIKVAAEIITEWSPEKGLAGTQDLLQKFPKGTLHLVHGWGGMVEVPAARYAHSNGREEILFTGGELTRQTKEAIENGWEYGVIIHDPAMVGTIVMDTLPRIAPKFDAVPADVVVPLPVCTKANLADFKPF